MSAMASSATWTAARAARPARCRGTATRRVATTAGPPRSTRPAWSIAARAPSEPSYAIRISPATAQPYAPAPGARRPARHASPLPPRPGMTAPAPRRPPRAGDRLHEIRDARPGMPQRSADQPPGAAGRASRDGIVDAPHGRSRLHHRHRAARVARPRPGRGALRGGREARRRDAARELGRTLRVPGFRAGKAPAPVVIKRIGREAVLDEAVRDSIGTWYSAAIDAAAIVPVGEPDLDLGDLPRQGEPLKFSIEIGVRPKAKLGEYKGLEVGRREPAADDEAVDAEIERLRERSGRLETVERAAAARRLRRHGLRSARSTASRSPAARGATRWSSSAPTASCPASRTSCRARRPGEERTIAITFPDDYGAPELAGQEAEFAVSVKEVKAKELPAVDDDLAAEAGFDTLDELREDIRARLREADEQRIEAEFRETVLDAAVAGATVDIPDALVEARSRELWDQMLHSLSHQGISKEMYLRIAGREEEDIVEQGKADAEKQLKREAVLAARRRRRGRRALRRGGHGDDRARRPGRADEPEEAARPDALERPARRAEGRARAAQGARPPRGVGRRRSASSRRGRATSCGRPARRARAPPPGSSGRPAADAQPIATAAPSSADARIPISTSSTCSASAPLARCGVPSSTARQRSSSPSPRALSVPAGERAAAPRRAARGCAAARARRSGSGSPPSSVPSLP